MQPGGYPGGPAPYNPYAQQQQGQPGEPPVAPFVRLAYLGLPNPPEALISHLQVLARRWRGLEATSSSQA